MAIFAVMLTFGDMALRDQVRPTHRIFLREQYDAKRLVESGPFVDDTGALMVYEAESEDAVRKIIRNDPYFLNDGVVANVDVKEWNIVFPHR